MPFVAGFLTAFLAVFFTGVLTAFFVAFCAGFFTAFFAAFFAGFFTAFFTAFFAGTGFFDLPAAFGVDLTTLVLLNIAASRGRPLRHEAQVRISFTIPPIRDAVTLSNAGGRVR